VNRQSESFAFYVPESEVEGALRVDLLAAGRIKPGDKHLLPECFDLEGVVADQGAGALFECVLEAAFANSGDSDVGFDRDDHVALVESLVEIGWAIDADTSNFGFWQGSFGELRAGQNGSRGGRK